MHAHSCSCARCQSQRAPQFPIERFSARARPAAPLSEAAEVELAMELLGVSSEAEWEQFLGKMFKGIKKIGGKLLKPLGGVLKGLAKKALPVLGGALGSFIPIPGVGTAIGTALGSAVGKALELEFGEMESDEAELETARHIVRVAASTAQRLADAPQGMAGDAAVRAALLAAARAHVPGFAAQEAELLAEAEQDEAEQDETAVQVGATTGRWERRGRAIVLLGA